jgi:hypothetical protein
MNTEFSNKKESCIYLKVSIVEPILLSCINGVSFPDLQLNLQRVATEMVLKDYLFHLIDGLFITYDGKKKIYLTCNFGLDLLNLIYIQKERKTVDYLDLSIKVE